MMMMIMMMMMMMIRMMMMLIIMMLKAVAPAVGSMAVRAVRLEVSRTLALM